MSTLSNDYDLEQLTLSGSYRNIGLQYGHHFKAKIQKHASEKYKLYIFFSECTTESFDYFFHTKINF